VKEVTCFTGCKTQGQKGKEKSMESTQAKKLYKTIIADPPWELDQRGNYGAINHYSLLSLDKIKAMPVADLAQPNAHLYLWVTNGVLPYGFEVLKAWGFEFRSIYTWVKPRLGLGNYMRNATEHVLFATRGKAPVLFKGQPTWGFFPLQEHSHKPEEFHRLVERLSPGPYLELFARRRQPGWDIWGNEVESDINIPGYPVPKIRKAA
jgi:N6-adenosine-specific RNA methylase IME4